MATKAERARSEMERSGPKRVAKQKKATPRRSGPHNAAARVAKNATAQEEDRPATTKPVPQVVAARGESREVRQQPQAAADEPAERADGAATFRDMTRGRRRGWIVALAALAAADAIVVALRQTGVIRRLPEPPGRIWDTNRVVTAPVAYAMGVPDAPVAAVVYLSMIGFAARLGRRHARRRPWSALGLAAGVIGAGGGRRLLPVGHARPRKEALPVLPGDGNGQLHASAAGHA